MTTYDEIYSEFLTNTETENINLPSSTEKIYKYINGAVRLFNNRLQTDIKCDDNAETLNKDLDDNELLILAHFLRLMFLKNQLTYFTTLYSPFEKDIGVRNFQSQSKALESIVENEKNTIDELIFNTLEEYL